MDMKFLFRASPSLETQSLTDRLESDGIGCRIRNGAALFGEGTTYSALPEVWVEDDLFQRALDVKRDWTEQKSVLAGDPKL